MSEEIGEAVSTEGCRPETAPVPAITASPAWTAGPWRTDGHKVRDGKVVSVTISHGLNSYGDGPEGYICVTCEGLDGKSEANARLIAAAPDLYAACLALQMEAHARGCGLRIADEAIAKAREESQ